MSTVVLNIVHWYNFVTCTIMWSVDCTVQCNNCFTLFIDLTEHEACAIDINELRWHCAYQGRIEARISERVHQAGTSQRICCCCWWWWFFFSTVMKYFNLIFSLVVRKRHAEHKCPQLHVSSGCQSTCLVWQNILHVFCMFFTISTVVFSLSVFLWH